MREIRTSVTVVTVLLIVLFSVPVVVAAEAPDEIVFSSKIESMKKAGVGSVLYPHRLHERLYECGDCHPRIFKEEIGANDVNMQKNIDGKYCGSSGCHNSAEAFPLYLCENCHMGIK